jgi:type IV fimbrial biogenesis protein FimT
MKNVEGQGGYTVVEVLVATILMATLLSSAAPAFRNTAQNAALAGQLETLTSGLRQAQSLAAKTGGEAFVCASNDGSTCSNSENWGTGWIVVDASISPNRIVKVVEMSGDISLKAKGFAQGDRITFTPNGMITDTLAPGTFVFCDDRGRDFANAAIVTRVGLVRNARDGSDTNNIVEDDNGANVTCT